MARRQEYHLRVPKTLNFENQLYTEFQQLCEIQGTSVSKKLQEFMQEQLEKNALGQESGPMPDCPIVNNAYYERNKRFRWQRPKPLQSSLDPWMYAKNITKLYNTYRDLHTYEQYCSASKVTAVCAMLTKFNTAVSTSDVRIIAGNRELR